MKLIIFEFESVEIGGEEKEWEEDDFGEYNITKFHDSEYDPSYFKKLEVGTIFFKFQSFDEGTLSFDPIEQEEELNIWEAISYYELGIFLYNNLWDDGGTRGSDWVTDYEVNGRLYVKDGKNSFTEIDLEELCADVFENFGDELNEDNLTFYLKNKYKGK